MTYYEEHRTMYKRKLVSRERAVLKVEDGARVHFGTGAGVVDALDRALAQRVHDLYGVQVMSTVAIREKPFETYKKAMELGAEGVKHVRFISAHFNANERKMAEEGNCWYLPMMFCELPDLWNIDGKISAIDEAKAHLDSMLLLFV